MATRLQREKRTPSRPLRICLLIIIISVFFCRVLKLIERGVAAKTKSSQVLKRSSKGCIRMYKISIIFIGIFLFPIVSLSQEVDLQKVAVLRKDITINIQYLIAVPQEEPATEGWPLMLFLHGLGECGSDINLVKRHGPPKRIENEKRFPFVVVSPQCPRNVREEVVGRLGDLPRLWMKLSKAMISTRTGFI